MKKIILTLMVCSFSCAFAASNALLIQNSNGVSSTNPGDVNFGVDLSPNNHAFKFRLLVGSAGNPTVATGCISPNTGFPETLTKYAIVQNNVDVKVQASDCTGGIDNWKNVNTNFNYQNQYYYNVACDLVNMSCHM